MSDESPTVMRAVVATGDPLDEPSSFVDREMPRPGLRPFDLLVEVEAVSVNPVDFKVRQGLGGGAGAGGSGSGSVLGYDGAGTVRAVGHRVSLFQPGDEVYWAGDRTRAGSNAEFQAVDSRIVGRKPASLDWGDAAALPLTAITAWEALFDKLRLGTQDTGTLLVVGGAGGVGSILIQLAKLLTGVTVLATAARPASQDWVRRMGADQVVAREDLASAVLAVAPDGVDHAFTAYAASSLPALARVVKPFGQVVSIDGAPGLDLGVLVQRSITWHWEWMFTRSRFETPDIQAQHHLLNRVAALIDAGALETTATTTIRGIDAEHLREAHRTVESLGTVGKVVLVGQ